MLSPKLVLMLPTLMLLMLTVELSVLTLTKTDCDRLTISKNVSRFVVNMIGLDPLSPTAIATAGPQGTLPDPGDLCGHEPRRLWLSYKPTRPLDILPRCFPRTRRRPPTLFNTLGLYVRTVRYPVYCTYYCFNHGVSTYDKSNSRGDNSVASRSFG